MAARATITFKNLEKVLKQLEQYGEEKDKQIGHAVEKTTWQVADRAVNRLRETETWVTGTLGRSITPEMLAPKEGRVFTNVPYALVVEFGFSGIQYVRPHKRNMTHIFGRRLASPKPVNVRYHGRRVRRFGVYFMTDAALYGETELENNIREAVR